MPVLAAVRELKEETNLDVYPDDLELFHIRSNETDTPESPYLYLFFRADKTKCRGMFRINEPKKCDDMKFFDKNDLPKLITQASLVAISSLDSDSVLFSKTQTP
jgi:ADP-ribose pyrophosphatase YjhB (NUDIX family)